MAEVKKRIYIDLSKDAILNLYGIADENLRFVEKALHVQIIGKDDQITIKGKKKDSAYAEKVLASMKKRIEEGKSLSRVLIEETIDEIKFGRKASNGGNGKKESPFKKKKSRADDNDPPF